MRVSSAIMLSLMFGSAGHAQSVQAGIEAWQTGQPTSAVEIWRPLAEAGDADAQFNLGQAYRLGRGVSLNLAVAQTWLGRAAAKGHVDAQTTLGLLLFDSGNRSEGLRWLASAAEQGEPRAMLIYGTALFNGDGVKQDPVLAYAYVSRSAAKGLAAAKTTLAEMDRLMPVSQRRLGVKRALAKASAGSKARTGLKPAAPAPQAQAARAPAQASPASAKPAMAPPQAGGSWRVQLGAFSKRSSAEALFRKVAANAALAGRQPVYVAAGAVTRLQVGPFASRAAAARACAALQGLPCFPVVAK